MSHPLRSLFLDMDSYFASVEQHFRPELRGRAIAVAPLQSEYTSCIAASYEAKAFGIKTGTKVAEARQLCPGIVIVAARPPLYVELHHQIIECIESFLHVDHVLSIDEMVCWLPLNCRDEAYLTKLNSQIKTSLARTFSDAIRCSIGIAPNGWLAKIASKMRKPDGFMILRSEDLPEALHSLKLNDLHGVGKNMELRIHAAGIHSVSQLCHAPREILHQIWGGIEGQRIWHKLRGEAFDNYDEQPAKRSMSHGHVLPRELREPELALAVAHRLTQKVALRMRHHGLRAGALDLDLRFVNHQQWSARLTFIESMDALFFTARMKELWNQRPLKRLAIKKINIVLHQLVNDAQFTPSLFAPTDGKRDSLNQAMDTITDKFGKKALYLGGAHDAMNHVQAKIAFNHIPNPELEA